MKPIKPADSYNAILSIHFNPVTLVYYTTVIFSNLAHIVYYNPVVATNIVYYNTR